MKDWVLLLTAAIQCYTAYLLLRKEQKNKKGTKRSHRGKRK